MQIRVRFTGSNLEYVGLVCLLLCGQKKRSAYFQNGFNLIWFNQMPLMVSPPRFYRAVSQSPSYHHPTMPPSYVAGPSGTCSAKDGQFQRDKRSFSRCLVTGAHWHSSHFILHTWKWTIFKDIENENSFMMVAYRHIHLQKTSKDCSRTLQNSR